VTDWIRRHPLPAVLALALLLALFLQGARGLWDPDEGRYTNVALQMIHSGDYVSLRRNEEALHFTKPPLTYWAIAGSINTFGRSEWAVRLPIGLAYVLSVWLVFAMGRRLVPERPWLPALVYATSPVPFLASNLVTTDTVLAATEALAVACYVRHRFGGGGPRWLDAMWTAFGLAFMTKGPPALLPLLAILAFEGFHAGGLRRLGAVMGRPLGLLGFAVVGFTWYLVVIRRHPGLLDYFLGHEVYARIATDKLRRFPQWYGPLVVYLPTLVLGSLPWFAMVAPRLRALWAARRPTDEQTRFLWWWFALPLAVFCLARSRLPLYVLPLFAPLCLLLARALRGATFGRGAVVLLGAWVLVLLGLKFAATQWVTDKDGREFARKLQPLLPGPPEELHFVEDTARNGLNLYFDTDIERLSFKPQPKMLSDSSYDQTLAEELREDEAGRVFIMKREVERYFLDALRAGGETPVPLGVIQDAQGRPERERVVYTLAGEFPATEPPATP
jgi:4-amino-4-deoxy-L-arabinose transferase-like glycosyltransferase